MLLSYPSPSSPAMVQSAAAKQDVSRKDSSLTNRDQNVIGFDLFWEVPFILLMMHCYSISIHYKRSRFRPCCLLYKLTVWPCCLLYTQLLIIRFIFIIIFLYLKTWEFDSTQSPYQTPTSGRFILSKRLKDTPAIYTEPRAPRAYRLCRQSVNG